MSIEKEPQFTPREEGKIDYVTSFLLDEGEEAIERLQATRYRHKLLEFAILVTTRSLEDSRAAGGRTVELADEAIKRAQNRLKEEGRDRVSILKRQIEEKRNIGRR